VARVGRGVPPPGGLQAVHDLLAVLALCSLAFHLGCDGSAKLAPALLELGQAVAFEVLGDVIEIDARCR
jgi:hypothetical protein